MLCNKVTFVHLYVIGARVNTVVAAPGGYVTNKDIEQVILILMI